MGGFAVTYTKRRIRGRWSKYLKYSSLYVCSYFRASLLFQIDVVGEAAAATAAAAAATTNIILYPGFSCHNVMDMSFWPTNHENDDNMGGGFWGLIDVQDDDST